MASGSLARISNLAPGLLSQDHVEPVGSGGRDGVLCFYIRASFRASCHLNAYCEVIRSDGFIFRGGNKTHQLFLIRLLILSRSREFAERWR